MRADTNHAPCPFCLSPRRHALSTPYARCGGCGSVLQWPLPSADRIESYYESYLDAKGAMNPGYLDEASCAALARERDLTLSEIGFPADRIARGRNVELGCANGLFVRYLVGRGSVSTLGLDVSESLLAAARALPGVGEATFLRGSLEAAADGSCDNLFMFNVIEHSPDVAGLVARAFRVLVRGGLAVVETPVAGLVSRAFGPSWRHLMPDEHLAIPSARALYALFSRNGFRPLGSTRFGCGLSAGSAPRAAKAALDALAKRFGFGDRLCALFERT